MPDSWIVTENPTALLQMKKLMLRWILRTCPTALNALFFKNFPMLYLKFKGLIKLGARDGSRLCCGAWAFNSFAVLLHRRSGIGKSGIAFAVCQKKTVVIKSEPSVHGLSVAALFGATEDGMWVNMPNLQFTFFSNPFHLLYFDA